MLVILRSVKLFKVKFEDVRKAYVYFGFNEEVVVLLRYFHPTNPLGNYYFPILNFVMGLEYNPKLSIDNIGNLDLVTKLGYRKLINSLPEWMLANNETIKLKKQILNKVPSLFEMSRYVFQKSLQKFHNIKDCNQFVKVAESLSRLPSVLKNNICQELPIYFDESVS
ncbi:hypothetical protein ILUMI_10870 [Ignelater luminosus]|uniref:Uncharacterized protein n=1 Tax=Ignelater luminosus TaxID=2038154 RepID=A0A8K0GD80_IGNLU|nr:hypothetical protein ILUMI_10870 [Ignelater luminosus]